jgi:hypothetical protein
MSTFESTVFIGESWVLLADSGRQYTIAFDIALLEVAVEEAA